MILGCSLTDHGSEADMDFNFTEEQQLLQDSVEKFLAKNYSFEQRREIIEAREGTVRWPGKASPRWACSACRFRRSTMASAAAGSTR